MLEHLVQSHMGGYYISDEDIVTIQRICEQCFDRDNVLVSWEKGNKKEQLDQLIIFLNADTVLTYEDIIKYVDLSNEVSEIKDELKNIIEYFTFNKKNIIEDISDNKHVSKKMLNELNKYVDNLEKDQLEFIDNCDYSQILNIKIKKISYNKKHNN